MLFEDEEVSWGCILDVDDESQTFARRETILMPPGKRMRLMEDDSEDDVIIGLQEGADKQPETCPSDNAYLGIQPQFMDVDEHGTEGMMVDEVDMTFGGEEAPTESLQKDDVLKRLETASIKIQSLMRMIRCRREFRETLSRIILVQSLWRRNLARRRFVKDRRSIIKIQRWWKRRKQQKESSPSVRRSRRNTTKVVNYSLEEKKKTLEKIRQKRLELQKQLVTNATETSTPVEAPPITINDTVMTEIPDETPQQLIAKAAEPPISAPQPDPASQASTISTSASQQPATIPPSVILAKLTQKQLQLITDDNTRRNNGFVFCTLKVQVVRMEEPRPPSPSEKLKQQMKEKANATTSEADTFVPSIPTKIRWNPELTERFQYDPGSLIRPISKRLSPPRRVNDVPPACGKSLLKKSTFGPISMDPVPKKVLVTVKRVEFMEDVVSVPPTPSVVVEPATTTPKKSPAVRKQSTPGPGRVAAAKRAGTPMPGRVKR